MLYSAGAPECVGSPVLPTVLAGGVASQWSHTVPTQMPWTVPPSQRPFSCGDQLGASPFMPTQQAMVAPVAAPAAPVVPLPQSPLLQAPFNDKVTVLGGAPTPLPPMVQPSQVFTPSLPSNVPLAGGCLPKLNPTDSTPQLMVYPGDPCSSSAPQIVPVVTEEPAVNGPIHRHGLSSQPRQPFPSTSYCAPRFKRKLRSGISSSDGGVIPCFDESEVIRGKIFVTEQMVTRMGDLSLNDERLKKTGLFESAPSQTLRTSSSVAETGATMIASGENNNNKEEGSLRNFSKEMLDENEDVDEENVDTKSDSEGPVRICADLKPAVAGSSPIEDRLAMDMWKKSTMAVAIWRPLKIPLLPPAPAAEPPTSSGGNDDNSSDMEQQEADRGDNKASLPTEMEELSGTSASITEDIMEIT